MKILILCFTLLFSQSIMAAVGKITALSGQAVVERGVEKIAATVGFDIEESDEIRTQDKANLQLVFNDKTVITLGKNTHFVVNRYLFDNSRKSEVDFSLTKGFLKSMTGAISKVAPQRFKIRAKTNTIGIRGTVFTLFFTEKSLILSTLSGANFMIDKLGNVHEVLANQQLLLDLESQKTVIKEMTQSGEGTAPLGLLESAEEGLAQAQQTQANADQDTALSNQDNSEPPVEDPIDDPQDPQLQKVTHNSEAHSRYGYWWNLDESHADSVWAEGDLQTSEDLINDAIQNGGTASYNGSLVAIGNNRVLGEGDIELNMNFANSEFDGSMDMDFNSTRWGADFGGEINASGYQVNRWQDADTSHITNTSGSLEGAFYGANAEETTGTFDINGRYHNADFGATGSFGAAGDGIEAP